MTVPATPTYREALDNSTARLRKMLQDISGGTDTQYSQILANVPFRIEDKTDSGGAHFFYSADSMGSNACGGVAGYSVTSGVGYATMENSCVVTELPERLIRDVYGNGGTSSTLGIHEWSHTYHVALPSATQTDWAYETDSVVKAALAGVTAAYENFRDVLFDTFDKTDHAWLESDYGGYYWYAMANEREYFKVLTEAYANTGSDDIGKWPKNRAQLLSEDPTGHAAVNAMWELPAADVANALRGCEFVSGVSRNAIKSFLLSTLAIAAVTIVM